MTSQALNQLKLASIDEKNWPSDEMPRLSQVRWAWPDVSSLGCLRRGPPALPVEGRPWEGGVGTNRSAPIRADRSDEGGAGARALGEGPESTTLRTLAQPRMIP